MLESSQLWFEYLLRFAHLVAGVIWIGESFYFIWLDSAFTPPQNPKKNVDGEVFMVHGGFYYQVEKRRIYPGELPNYLHWFKWAATSTWLTGFLLFVVLYYSRGASLLVARASPSPLLPSGMGQSGAICISMGLILVSWIVYDLVWHPKLLEKELFKSKRLSSLLTLSYFSLLIYLCTELFNGRGAFIQMGVIWGTMMVLNVWIRILPNQKRMLNSAENGEVPDYSLGLKSKTRSVHNTYFIFPVLLIMLSNHFPGITEHAQNWLLLIILSVSGALVRHAMVAKDKRQRWTLLPAALGLLALVWMTQPTRATILDDHLARPTYAEVAGIISNRCLACHSSNNTDDLFKLAPNGVLLEDESHVLGLLPRIYQRVFVDRTMPFGNKTGITEEEREKLARFSRP